MSNPLPYLIRMLLFMVAVGGLGYVLHEDLLRVFMNTPILNGVILSVLVIGIFFVIRQVLLLWPEVRWLRRFQEREEDTPAPPTNRINLLVPMATMLGERQDVRLSATATRAVLDGIAARLDERRELARYMIGLLIFLGLLGTFWGLLQTISAVADAISGLQVVTGDSVQMFAKLKSSIEGPLKGMATAFGASLFGLSGSLVLGFLELQASQAQGRFHIELEEWLARATSLSSGGMSAFQGGGSVPAYIEALLERNAEGVDGLIRTLQHLEEGRQASAAGNSNLVERLASLAETMRAQQILLARFTELSIELRTTVGRLSDRPGGEGDRESTITHQRNVEAQLARLTDRTAAEADREALLLHQRSIEGKVGRLAEDSARARTELIDELRGLAARVTGRSDTDRDALLEQQRNIERQIVHLADETTRHRTEVADELRTAISRLLTTDADREAVATQQRNIEAHLARLAEESTVNRTALAEELRGEIRLLARTIAHTRAATPGAG